MKLPFYPNDYPGTLIAVEGISRAGKSTFIRKIQDNINSEVVLIEWNSNPHTCEVIRRLKIEKKLDPLSWSLIHILDYNLTYKEVCVPALENGCVVIADRYLFTSWVRDSVRKVNTRLLLNIYREFVRPEYVFYLKITPEVSLKRHVEAEGGLYENIKEFYYAFGLDIHENMPIDKSYLLYQESMLKEYNKLIESNNFIVINNNEKALDIFRAFLS